MMGAGGKDILAYDSFSANEPALMGTLHVDVVRGAEAYSFEFDGDWPFAPPLASG